MSLTAFVAWMIGTALVCAGAVCVIVIIRGRQRAAYGEVEARRRWQQGTERYFRWCYKFLMLGLVANVVLVPLIVAADLLIH